MRKVLYILGELEDPDLQWLYEAGTTRPIPSDTQIIEQGRACDSLFIVVDGEFGVSVKGHEIARLGTGEVVGDMSLLDSRPASATVVATRSSSVFDIPCSLLRGKLRADLGFAARFYRALCIFLANRLSRADSMVGTDGRVNLDQNEQSEDEISPEALENVALAGARFDWFLQRIRGN